MVGRSLSALGSCVIVGALASGALAQGRLSPAASEVIERRGEAVDRALETGDYYTGESACRELVDRAAAWATARDVDALREAELGRRMMHFAREIDPASAERVVEAFKAAPGLGAHFLFTWREEHDDEKLAAALLLRLIDERGADVARYPALAASVALVHDHARPYQRRINENSAASADPVAIFGFYADHAKDMRTDPSRLPPEALMFVVDTTEPVEQMAWALDRYRAGTDIGARYFEIEYDTQHFKRGTPKKVSQAGTYDLQTILKWGGVCADQAYFAEHVAKAACVPAVYMNAAGADVSHAWVGYVDRRGRSLEWNLDSGRYEAYQDVQGWATLPQTGERIPDTYLEMLAGAFTERDADRWNAVATTSAVRLWTVGVVPEGLEALGDANPGRREARTRAIEDRLDLLRLGLSRAPHCLEGWELLADLAATKQLDQRQLDEWARVLDRLCGKEYPAFSVHILSMMFTGIDDPGERERMWDWAYKRFDSRKDLAAGIRLTQAGVAVEMGEKGRALSMIKEVINRFANDTPMILPALRMGENLLRDEGKLGEIVRLYEAAWPRVDRPAKMGGEFATQSNWYRVGQAYLRVLREAGDPRAPGVERQLQAL